MLAFDPDPVLFSKSNQKFTKCRVFLELLSFLDLRTDTKYITCKVPLKRVKNLATNMHFENDFFVILYLLDQDPESASLMQIRIQLKGSHFNADPCGSGSELFQE